MYSEWSDNNTWSSLIAAQQKVFCLKNPSVDSIHFAKVFDLTPSEPVAIICSGFSYQCGLLLLYTSFLSFYSLFTTKTWSILFCKSMSSDGGRIVYLIRLIPPGTVCSNNISHWTGSVVGIQFTQRTVLGWFTSDLISPN